jgi:hypothetical protein
MARRQKWWSVVSQKTKYQHIMKISMIPTGFCVLIGNPLISGSFDAQLAPLCHVTAL